MEIVKYDIDEATLSNMESIYPNLAITDLEDKGQFESVHLARMVVKGYRVDLDHAVKKYNDQANQFKKKVKADAAPIYARLEPMETHLAAEEQKVTDEKKRIQEEEDRIEREKVDLRVEGFLEYGVVVRFDDVALMTEKEYRVKIADAEEASAAKQARLADEKAKREAEDKRLADQRADQDRIAAKQKADQAILDEANAKIKADHKAAILSIANVRYGLLKVIGFVPDDGIDYLGELSTEKWEEVYDSQKAAHEKHQGDARAKADQDAKDKPAGNGFLYQMPRLRSGYATDKMEAELDAEAEGIDSGKSGVSKPDREKLFAWMNAVNSVPRPEIKNHLADVAFSEAIIRINIALKNLRKALEEL